MKEFKKFILRGTLFIAIFFSAIKLCGLFDNIDAQSNDNHNIIKLQNISRYDSVEALFIGNSYCYNGINTQLLDSMGIKSANLGIATAGPYFYDLILNSYTTNTKQKPRYIFLLLSPTTFSSKSDNFIDYPIHRYLKSPISNEAITFKYNYYNRYSDLLLNSVNKCFSNCFSDKKKNQDSSTLTPTGYIKNHKVYNKNILKETGHLYHSLLQDKFNQEKALYLTELIKSLQEQKNHVILFELPTHNLLVYFSKEYLRDYFLYVEALKKQHVYINLNLNLHDYDFGNIDHLNKSGANKVTLHLFEQYKLTTDTNNEKHNLYYR